MLALALAIAPTPDLDPGPDPDPDPVLRPHPHPHPTLTATTGFFQRPPLSLRTGSNHDDDGSAGDTESGGQPLDISVSFQYNLIKERIPEFYQKFGMAYEDSFARCVQDALLTMAIPSRTRTQTQTRTRTRTRTRTLPRTRTRTRTLTRYAQDALFTVATSKTPREFWEDRGANPA